MRKAIFVNVIVVVLLISTFLFYSPSVYAGTNYDVATTSIWNVRIDGAVAGDSLGYGLSLTTGDLNNDGLADIVLGAPDADNNSRGTSGSVYVVTQDVVSSQTGSGNTIDLSDSDNYFLRFDGALAGEQLGRTTSIVADLNNNGINDLIISSDFADHNSQSGSGTTYIIYDDILDNYSGTGNNIDLATSTNYHVRYDGNLANDRVFVSAVDDLNQDGINDLVLAGDGVDNNSRSASGSIYIIYSTLLDDNTGTGNNVRLDSGSNYNIRYDGAVAVQQIGYYASVRVADMNGNGNNDLIFGAQRSNYNSLATSGSTYIIYDSLIDDHTGTGNNVDLNTDTNWNVRFDGAESGDFSGEAVYVADIDNDGTVDLGMNAWLADRNSRSNSGVFYIINNSIFSSATGTGNNFELSDSSNWTMRVDGAAADDVIGDANLSIFNYDNIGYLDILSGGYSDYNSRSGSGSTYMINSPVFESIFSSTGNIFDLDDSDSYSSRFDGAEAGDFLNYSPTFGDINNDSSIDLLLSAYSANNNSRASSGSVYFLFNYPHTISYSDTGKGHSGSNSNFNIVGSVSASNSVANIAGVQYKLDSNDPDSGWSNCTATDGAFDSTSESYACEILNTSIGSHTAYIRSYDAKGLYTPTSKYTSISLTADTTPNANSSGDSSGPQIKAAPDGKNLGGTFTQARGNNVTGTSATAIIEAESFDFAGNLTVNSKTTIDNGSNEPIKITTPLRLPTNQGTYHQMGTEVFDIWITAVPAAGKENEEHAKIIPSLQRKSSILSLSYTDAQLFTPGAGFFPESSLKIAHSLDGITWKIVASSVVDPVNNTVAIVDKIGGYYAIFMSKSGGSFTRNTFVRGVQDDHETEDEVNHADGFDFPDKPTYEEFDKNEQIKNAEELLQETQANNAKERTTSFFDKIKNFFSNLMFWK